MSEEISPPTMLVQNYIDGSFETKSSTLDSLDPSTGRVWARIPDSDGRDVERAVKAASAAFEAWAGVGGAVRAGYLKRVAEMLEERKEVFAKAESKDQGKTVGLAKMMDVPKAIECFKSWAEAWSNLAGTSQTRPELGVIDYSTREPVGVAALIVPWNLPLYLAAFKLAPALMAGNTVVLKPSEFTSVTAWMLAELFDEAGLPKGVFNLVCGTGDKAGEALVRHKDTRIISFTGSTATGSRVASIAAPMMKKISLECGGKNPAIVFKDANLETTIPGLIKSAFLNQGEVCLSMSRFFVQEEVYEAVLERFLLATKKLKVGDPKEHDTFVGAINSKTHLEKILRYIEYAKEDGGQILCGETIDELQLPEHLKEGYFCQPTVITGLADDSRCMQEEIFGPVVCFTSFKTESEAIARANDVRYGLCATVWSENVGTVHRVARQLKVGTVWANCWCVRSLEMPFGGVKDSGVGREGIRASMDFYTEEKCICVKIQ